MKALPCRGYDIILGSASPRRAQLMKAAGFDFSVKIPGTDEHIPEGKSPREIPVILAQQKSEAIVQEGRSRQIIITADTIVCLGNEILGKPRNTEEATTMLKKLRAETHSVFTGVCIRSAEFAKTFHIESKVLFKNYTDEDILKYIELFMPFDKAGSYGLQECSGPASSLLSDAENLFLKEYGLESMLHALSKENFREGWSFDCIGSIEGSYFNVMGLPLAELVSALEELQ